MANQKISELNELISSNVNNQDLLPIVDVSASETKNITIESILELIPSSTIPRTIILKDSKPADSYGGNFNAGAWRVRDLNSATGDTSLVTLAANFTDNNFDNNGATPSVSAQQFTLEAGTYFIEGSCPASYVSGHCAKLYNVTDAADVIIGTAEDTSNATATATTTRSFIVGSFTIVTQKTFDIRHRSNASKTTNGLGQRVAMGVREVYSVFKITKTA